MTNAGQQQSDDDQRLYLTFLQDTINRMASNSASLKRLFVSFLSLLVGGAVITDKWEILIAGLFCSLIFWGMDAYYLMLERRYREKYTDAISGHEILYDMALSKCRGTFLRWCRACLSFSIWPIYFSCIIAGIAMKLIF